MLWAIFILIFVTGFMLESSHNELKDTLSQIENDINEIKQKIESLEESIEEMKPPSKYQDLEF